MPTTQTSRPRLLLRFHSLGDVVLTTGLLRPWSIGGAGVDVLTERRFRPIFDGHPAVGRLWYRETLSGLPSSERPYFQEVLDLQGTVGSRAMAQDLAPAVRSLSKWSLARRWTVFWGDRFPRPRIPDAVGRYARAAGLPDPDRSDLYRPELCVTPAEEQEAARQLGPVPARAPTAPVALVVGASRRSKAYPPDRFAEVGRRLERQGCEIWWVEDPSTPEIAPPVGRRVALALGPLKAALARCRLVITNDSGPMHLATGLGVPVLSLFGSSVRALGFAPRGSVHRLLEVPDLGCRPCGVHGRNRCWLGHWRCLRDIDPAQVAEIAVEMLAG